MANDDDQKPGEAQPWFEGGDPVEQDPPAAHGDTRVPSGRPERAAASRRDEAPRTRGWFDGKDEASGAGEGDEPGWLERLTQTLTELAADITSVTVRTYTAEDVAAAVADRKEIGQVGQLRAWTRIALDGDTDVCVPVSNGKVDRSLWELHQAMVEQAQAHRSAMIDTLVGSVSGLWNTKK